MRRVLPEFQFDSSKHYMQLILLPNNTSRENSLELIGLFSINKVSLVQVSSCSNTESIRDDPYWTSRKNSLELIELSNVNKVSLV